MRNEIEEAITQVIRTVRTKNDAFLVLCSLNLLNVAVKNDEYKGLIGYGLIKPAAANFVKFCIANKESNLVEELKYNAQEQCTYIRCYGIQFSFHHVGVNQLGEDFVKSFANERVVWDGVRLQPIALELYHLAKDSKGLSANEIQDRFNKLISKE